MKEFMLAYNDTNILAHDKPEFTTCDEDVIIEEFDNWEQSARRWAEISKQIYERRKIPVIYYERLIAIANEIEEIAGKLYINYNHAYKAENRIEEFDEGLEKVCDIIRKDLIENILGIELDTIYNERYKTKWKY